MPLHWTVDSREQLVVAVAEGGVTRPEFETYLDMLTATKVHGYRKLFDGRDAHPAMSGEDVYALGVRMRGFHAVEPPGPLAVVMSHAHFEQFSRVIGILAAADRPMRVFTEVAAARAWLDKRANRLWLPKTG